MRTAEKPAPASNPVDSPVVLTIAGSDSSGGAGIQADLKTFAAHRCYGASAITAITVQNTVGVSGVHPVPPDVVAAQVKAVFDDLPVRAVKTGMLVDANTVRAVVAALEAANKEGAPSSSSIRCSSRRAATRS